MRSETPTTSSPRRGSTRALGWWVQRRHVFQLGPRSSRSSPRRRRWRQERCSAPGPSGRVWRQHGRYLEDGDLVELKQTNRCPTKQGGPMSPRSNDGKILDLANGDYAYLQEGGSWGSSNAGLVTSDGVAASGHPVRRPTDQGDAARAPRCNPAASSIKALVNTHNNGDHTHGDQLLTGSRISRPRRRRKPWSTASSRPTSRRCSPGAAGLGDLGRSWLRTSARLSTSAASSTSCRPRPSRAKRR